MKMYDTIQGKAAIENIHKETCMVMTRLQVSNYFLKVPKFSSYCIF